MKDFFKKNKKHLLFLLMFLVLVFTPMIFADQIQKDFGNVEVTEGSFVIDDTLAFTGVGDNLTVYKPSEGAEVTYKLYKPVTASSTNKLPAVLLLHGYQNDHETCDAYCIELSRRGIVVLAIDEYGHGGTNVGIEDRGYADHKVTVNFGLDSDVEVNGKKATYVTIGTGGAKRYKVMMNFSNLSFFNEKYTLSDNIDVNLYDSSMGGIAAYAFMSNLDYVQNDNMAISGHSMGTWASWTVAAAYYGTAIEPKATVLQCGEVFDDSAYSEHTLNFNNVLLLQAKWDEFNYFRDYQNTVSDALLEVGTVKYNFLTDNGNNITANTNAKWDTTYGDFADGSARMARLLYTNHRLTTHDANGMAAALDWFSNALNVTFTLKNTDQVFAIKELLVIIAMFSAIASMFSLFNILKNTKFFSTAIQSVPTNRDYRVKTGWAWWKGAIITMLISFATYPFMTQLGHGLLPLPENIFRMTIGNGFLSWYLLLIIIMLCTTIIPFKKSLKKDVKMDFVDLGLSRESHKDKFDWALLGKMALLAVIMVSYMYIQCVLCEAFFMLDFRFVWPFFKGFTWARFGQFLVYILIFVVFFILNNSKIFAQMRVKEAQVPGFKGFIGCWYKYALCMVGGILLIILLEYIPFFAELGPGADLLFGTTFGGPFMSLLIVFAPQVIVFSVICTYCYRKTGSVYLGAIIVAILACWIVTGGSAMF